jgi:NADH:ubiquinone oxidoreductase subunit 5 (subunit L)/multisubunit Na+/H+ antiporter MnhA subunit
VSGPLWLLPGVPVAVGAVLACAGRRADRLAGAVAVAAAVATAALGVWAALTRPAVEAPWLGSLRAGLAVDGLSAVLVGTVVTVALAVVVFSLVDIGRNEARARFFGMLLVFVGAMLATVTATSLGTLLFAWEIMGATSFALIGFWWADPVRPPAATTAFLVTRAGDLGLYLATAAAVAGLASLDIHALATAPSPWLHAIAAGLVLAAAGKSAQLPFSSWLSAAMQGPSPVSALLHSATMVAAGAYLLLRAQPVLAAAGWALPVVAWLGAATALALGLVAVAQRDLKQLLAASTCAQMGLLFLAVGAGSVAAGVAHLVSHAAFKSLLFLGAGVFLHALGTRDLGELTGAARRLRHTGIAFSVGALALAGVPPLSGWVTKDEILAAALHTSRPLWLVGLAAGAISALYAGKALVMLWANPAPKQPEHPVTPGFVLPMDALALAVAALAALGLSPVRAWFERLVGGTAAPPPAGWELTLSGLLAIGGIALVAAAASSGRLVALKVPGVPRSLVDWLGRWLGLDQAGAALVVRPVLALARGLAAVDDRVVDAGVRGAGRFGARLSAVTAWGDRRGVDAVVERLAAATVAGGAASRAADERVIDRVVEGLATALGRAGSLARRPQTGLLTQYYTQAVTVLGVVVGVLLLYEVIR